MIEDILKQIADLPPYMIYGALFLFSFLENVFPPSPSDLVVLVGGSLIPSNPELFFALVLLVTSLGSVAGFMSLFYVGTQLDRKVIRAGKFKFITAESLQKAELWFNKYGYWAILINRFLPGTRSVISFFAGMSELNWKRTAILSFISAMLWNSIILFLGVMAGEHIDQIDHYLSTYNTVVIIITVAIILFFIIRYFIKKKKTNKK